jgi:RING-like zinc finger
MRIRNKKTHKKKTFNKRKPKNTLKKNRSTRKIVKGGEKRKERDHECAICYEELNNPDNPDITLSCDHTFHRNCIINTCRHMRGPCLCPLCRGVLTPGDLNELRIAQPVPESFVPPQQSLEPREPPESLPPRRRARQPEVLPQLDTIDEFRTYINDKLRAPTREPLEKLDTVLTKFLGSDSLPVELYEDAMEFELEQIGPATFHRYRFIRIIDLRDIPAPQNRSNKKYFRYIDYEEAGHADEFHDPDLALIVAYDVVEV